jgi:hypothetical protein
MRFAIIAVSTGALVALLTTGAFMNNACKTDRALWWCAPAKTHISMNLSRYRTSRAAVGDWVV